MTRHQTPTSQADVDPAVPPTARQRLALRERMAEYVVENALVAPLTLEELQRHTDRALAGEDPRYAKYATVLLSNELWRPVLAGIPGNRRLLLLPQCLRGPDCQAKLDDWGYVCAGCGRCPIHDLQAEAVRLGYVVLIAEGSPMVMSLIESGQVEAVIGVSCLATLERVFPYMQAAAVPGIALPMLSDDCHDGSADLDWIWEAIYLTGDTSGRRLDLDAVHTRVAEWFAPEALDKTLGPSDDETTRIAREALTDGGKRWRPFLVAAGWRAMADAPDDDPPPAVRQLAVAVECFHKASLVHDDIEDDDSHRDGRQTLHARHGLPVALNAGDLLLGEGYRLIASADLPAEARAQAMAIAADGHRRLALGQGRELLLRGAWTLADTLAIAEAKTAPAFEVALRLAALAAGSADAHSPALGDYSQALGAAYQLQDDLDDLRGDLHVSRPSAVLAMATDTLTDRPAELLARLRAGEQLTAHEQADLRAAMTPTVTAPVEQRLDQRLRLAQAAIERLASPGLRTLLRRVLGKLFARTGRFMPCCVDLHPRGPDA